MASRVNPEYFLRTSRLGFRQWDADDLPLAQALWGDPEVSRFLGGPCSPDVVERKLTAELENLRLHQIQYWPLFLLVNDAHVGCCGLRPYKPEELIYEMGFHLRTQYCGMGLAAEAGEAVVNFAFENLCAKALFAGHHPQNVASKRVLEKLGFRFTHEELYPPTGQMHPSYLLTRYA
jgi:[ribosomal protein S5]-alanine N-acetyltransferase